MLQKEAPQNAPEFVKTVEIDHEGKAVHSVGVENVKSLLYVANLGSIELHPFNSSLKHLHNPDYTVLNLDPEDVSFDKVIEVAKEVHAVLEEIGVPNFARHPGQGAFTFIFLYKANMILTRQGILLYLLRMQCIREFQTSHRWKEALRTVRRRCTWIFCKPDGRKL